MTRHPGPGDQPRHAEPPKTPHPAPHKRIIARSDQPARTPTAPPDPTPNKARRGRSKPVKVLWWVTPTDLAPLADKLDTISKQLQTINKKADLIMAQVQVAQEDLDQLDSDLDSATQALSDKIDALAAAAEAAGTPLPAADLAALRDDVDTLRGLGAPAATEEPPA